MADIDPRYRTGHAHETQHLTYGQFGTANYDKGVSHLWRFLRDDDSIQARSPRGDHLLTTPPRLQLRFYHQRDVYSASVHRQQTQSFSSTKPARPSIRLSRQRPDATFALEACHQEPDEVDLFSSQQVKAHGDNLLACGYAAKLDARGYAQDAMGIPVVAFATGLAHEMLGIDYAAVDPVDFSGMSTRGSDTQAARQTSNALSYQFSSQDPILQVCFSRTHRVSTFIGVRKAQSSVLLQPVCYRSFSAKSLSQANPPSSTPPSFRLEHVLTLPAARTGGYPHAYIAFNPEDERQLAVIDTHGNWSVWDLSGKTAGSTRVLLRAHMKSSGRLSQHRRFRSAEQVYHDEWRRICWLVDGANAPNSLLVCDRCSAEVYSIEGGLVGQVDMRLGPRSQRHRILDIRQDVSGQGLCFALTSTRILILRLRDVYSDEDSSDEPLEMICSWSHFRGLGDSTLQIRTANLSQLHSNVRLAKHSASTAESFVALFSTRNKEITYYTFKVLKSGHASTLSASEPSMLPISDILLKFPGPISDLCFQFKESEKRRASNDGTSRLTLLIMNLRTAAGAVVEASFQCMDHQDLLSENVTGSSMALARASSSHHIKSSVFVTDDDDEGLWDFIVNDDVKETIHTQVPQHQRQEMTASRRVTYWQDILSGGAVDVPQAKFDESLLTLRSELFQQSSLNNLSRTLTEMASLAYVGDMERDSQDLARLIHEVTSNKQNTEASGLSIALVNSRNPPSALEQYNTLVEDYVESLVKAVPDRVRVTTERLSRTIGLEIFLSGYALRSTKVVPKHLAEKSPVQNVVDENESYTAELNPISAMSTQSSAQGDALSRLSNYTSISSVTPPGLYVRAVSEILEHLPFDMSAEPSQDSFKDAELNLAPARNKVSANSEPRTRRDIERLAAIERRSRREREELALKRGVIPSVALSSQLPQNEVHSQNETQVAMGASEAVGTSALSMTQPERGPHGGRDQVQRTGRKRLQGF